MRLLKNSFYNLAGAAIPMVVSIISIPIYINAIGLERYGALAIAWVLLGYFAQADFGIGRAVSQRVASHRDASPSWLAQTVISAFASISLLSLVVATIIYGAAGYFFGGPFQVSADIREELLAAVWVLALSNFVISFTGVAGGALAGKELFKWVSIGNTIGGVGMQLAPLTYALLVDANLTNLIVLSMAGRGLGLMVMLVAVWWAFLRGNNLRPSISEIKALSKFGVWIMVTSIIGPLMIFTDRFMIGALQGAVAVAVYTIPFQLAYRSMIVPISIVNALFPRFASAAPEAARHNCSIYTIFIGQIFAPLIIGAICLTSPLMHLWLGDNLDTRSILVGQILFASFWINALANTPYAYIQASGRPSFTAKLHLAELPIYIGLLYFLGGSFGLAGFAAAFGLRCFIDFLALAWRARVDVTSVTLALLPQMVLIAAPILVLHETDSIFATIGAAAVLPTISLAFALFQMPIEIRDRLSQLPVASKVIAVASRFTLGPTP